APPPRAPARGQAAGLQQQEREEGMHRGLIRGGIPGKNLRQPYRLAAELGPGQVGAAVRAGALVEEEVEDVEHAVEAAAQLVLRGNLDGDGLLANLTLRPYQTLGDGVALREEGRGDLVDAEAAHRLESEGDAGGRRKQRVAANEHHGELVVAQGGRLRRLLQPSVEAVELSSQRGFASQQVDGPISRHLEEP